MWNVGPYTLRTMGHFQTSEDRGGTRGQKEAHSFLIGHDLYLWSPKGFLTGSATKPARSWSARTLSGPTYPVVVAISVLLLAVPRPRC